MANISAAKPGVGGGVWMAPAGTTLPTDASTALNAAFKSLGCMDENGVTRSTSLSSEVVNAWGAAAVAVLGSKKVETVKFRFIETDNLEALGLAFGEATGTLANGITVKSKADLFTPRAFVISTLLKDNIHQRLVLPSAVVTAIGDVEYKDNGVIGCEVTLTAMADSAGVTVYDYQKTVTPSGT